MYLEYLIFRIKKLVTLFVTGGDLLMGEVKGGFTFAFLSLHYLSFL